MGYSKQDIAKVKQKQSSGEAQITALLNAGNTVATVNLGIVASKITLQATGDLAGTFTVSANGENFATGGSLAGTNGLVSYNTHNVAAVQITRSGGSGTVTVIAVG